MINRIEHIPVTPLSHPFARAAITCRFKENAYEEEEYFIHGTANVYDESVNGEISIIYHDAPYVNRILVRKPLNPGRFSGNVVVEILNPSARVDIDRIWIETWPYLVRHGDIYIGITAKSDVLDSLYSVNPERYSSISWKNPMPWRPLPKPGIFPVLPEYENGLFWDMLTDLTVALRSDGSINPIAGYDKPFFYLSGWSQCGGFITRYRETFAETASKRWGSAIFDGYFHAGAGSSRAPINTFAESEPFWSTREGFKGIIESSEPFMVLNTETETPYTRWAGDSDEPFAKFRVYEIAGSSHDNKYNLIDYYVMDEDLDKIGKRQPFYGLEEFPLDYPYEFLFAAALRNLFVWVREGVPAPPSQQVGRLKDGQSKKDAFGNTVGGLRTPFIDLPTCMYSKYCTLKEDPSSQRDFWGHVEPFSLLVLKSLYGSLERYEKLVASRTDELIALGYLLPCDRDEIIRTAKAFAAQRGL